MAHPLCLLFCFRAGSSRRLSLAFSLLLWLSFGSFLGSCLGSLLGCGLSFSLLLWLCLRRGLGFALLLLLSSSLNRRQVYTLDLEACWLASPWKTIFFLFRASALVAGLNWPFWVRGLFWLFCCCCNGTSQIYVAINSTTISTMSWLHPGAFLKFPNVYFGWHVWLRWRWCQSHSRQDMWIVYLWDHTHTDMLQADKKKSWAVYCHLEPCVCAYDLMNAQFTHPV